MGIPVLSDVLDNVSEATQAVPAGVSAIPMIGAPIAGAVATSALVQSATDDRGRFDDKIAAASEYADAERTRAWGERDALTRQSSSLEYSEHAITADDPFDAMSHAEIYAHVNEMNPETLEAIGEAWRAIAGKVDAGVSKFQQDVSGAIGEGWQGRGGSAALEAVLAYAQGGGELKTRVSLISNKVDEAKIALAEAKRSIPEPDGASLVENLLSALPGATWKQARYEAEEAERRAQQVMKEVYLPYLKRADDQVPILPPAPSQVTGGGGSGGGAPASGGGGGGSARGAGNATSSPFGFGGSGDGSAGSVGADSSGAGGPGSDPAAQLAGDTGGQGSGGDPSGLAPEGNSNAAPAGNDPRGTAGIDPASTTAASALGPHTGAVSGTPTGATPSSNPLGSGSVNGSGGGIGGSSGGAGGGGPSGSGGIGGGVLGPGGSGGGLSPGGRGGISGTGGGGSAGASGGRGVMGGGVGGMAPGRGNGQDDDVHDTPGYLITVENGNALIGDLPMVAPAVLGE